MDRRRRRQHRPWFMAIGLGLLLLGAAACGESDFSSALALVAPDSGDVEQAVSGSDDANPRSDMESIGPDAAMRIYYQFVDDGGRVQFVERLSDVPDAWREQVGYVEMSQPPPLTPEAARATWRISSARATEIKLASAAASTGSPGHSTQREEVILYSATWCGYCTQARAHLDRQGIRYELRDVDNGAIGRELKEKTGRSGVPVLDFSGEILRGYSAGAYDKAIRTIRG